MNITYTYSPIYLTSTHAFLIGLGLDTGSGKRAVGTREFILAAHGLVLSGVLFVLLAVHRFAAFATFERVYKVWEEAKRDARCGWVALLCNWVGMGAPGLSRLILALDVLGSL